MKKLLLILALAFVYAMPAPAQLLALTGCEAVAYTPPGFTYNPYPGTPVFWYNRRWNCLRDETPFFEYFQNGTPANGTDTQFPLAAFIETEQYWEPFIYVEESRLVVWMAFPASPGFIVPPEDYTVNQGTGVVTFNEPPDDSFFVYFTLLAEDPAKQSIVPDKGGKDIMKSPNMSLDRD